MLRGKPTSGSVSGGGSSAGGGVGNGLNRSGSVCVGSVQAVAAAAAAAAAAAVSKTGTVGSNQKLQQLVSPSPSPQVWALNSPLSTFSR